MGYNSQTTIHYPIIGLNGLVFVLPKLPPGFGIAAISFESGVFVVANTVIFLHISESQEEGKEKEADVEDIE
jgi:hypothetical protein